MKSTYPDVLVIISLAQLQKLFSFLRGLLDFALGFLVLLLQHADSVPQKLVVPEHLACCLLELEVCNILLTARPGHTGDLVTTRYRFSVCHF
jgi:hypothetical protein